MHRIPLSSNWRVTPQETHFTSTSSRVTWEPYACCITQEKQRLAENTSLTRHSPCANSQLGGSTLTFTLTFALTFTLTVTLSVITGTHPNVHPNPDLTR